MFTGIVEEVGTVRAVDERDAVVEVWIAAQRLLGDMLPGGSIAVNGCCLTATRIATGSFACELTPETLERTAFGDRLRAGDPVNLERPLRADGRFDGHIVQGHVDGVGRIVAMRSLGASGEMTVEAPPELDRYLVDKGSVAVDGVSLTVARRQAGRFTVALIPYTLMHTNLGSARPGGRVNLEVDVIAKYVERLLAPRT
jgi:riboflavin synthase